MNTGPQRYQSISVLARRERLVLLRALDPRGARVVLKALRPGLFTEQDAVRLRREFEILQRVDASAVAAPRGLETLDGAPALVLEDFGGMPLPEALTAPLATEPFLRVAIDVARCLEKVHAAQVVHKDIKPDNILIHPQTREVRLTDFGISTVLHVEQQLLARPDFVEGSFPYLAPEQSGRMNRAVDFRSDLYALGATLFEFLTGRLPFEASDPLEWVHAHLARPPPDPAELIPGLPSQLGKVVLKLLAKLPEDRYQSAAGLAQDLQRCLAQWQARGDIDAFSLAQQDRSERLQLSQKLYGRAPEIAQLRALFEDVVATRQPALALISGPSGIGKSSLVQELYEPLARERGFFCPGKFEQLSRHVPYSAITQALQELLRQILGVTEQQLATWRAALLAALGAHAGLMTTLLPDLELVIGKQPPVPPLGPAEEKNRFGLALENLLRGLTASDRPLAIFLDDVQWADVASLDFLQTLLTGAGPARVLVILAYRDNEVPPEHPLWPLLAELARRPLRRVELVLRPLATAEVNAFLADSLNVSAERSAPLAEVLQRKTLGSPFFMGEFLRALRRENLLRLDAVGGAWVWEQAEVESSGITENVIELMIDRMRRLSPRARAVLELAACVGNHFTLGTLALASAGAETELEAGAEELVHSGLLVSVGNALRFQHDRIEQAAYALIEPGARAGHHLRIGRQLLQRLPAEELEGRVFEVVGQLNRGLELMADGAERAEVSRLNQLAAARAKASTAYLSAREHLRISAALQPEDAWQSGYAPMFKLQRDLAEVEYLSGHLEEAEARFRALTARASSPLDRAEVQYQQVKLYQVAGQFEEAARISIDSLAALGVNLPQSPEEAGALLQQELATAKALLGARKVSELLDAKRMSDPTSRAITALLEAAAPPFYMVRPELFPIITVKMVNASLAHGNTEASCYAYGVYGLMLAAALGDVEGGFAFSELAIALNARFDDPRLKGAVLHLQGDHVNFWKRPFASDLPILERGFAACVEGGDLIYSNYIGFQAPWHLWETGAPLEEVHAFTRRFESFARTSKHLPALETIVLEQQFVRALQGATLGPTSLSSAKLPEEDGLRRLREARFACGEVYHHIMRVVLHTLHGEYGAALEWASQAEPLLAAALSMPIQTTYFFFHGLALAGAASTLAGPARSQALQKLEQLRDQHARWASHSPANFSHRAALLSAELARLEGKLPEALALYEQAMDESGAGALTQYQALSAELAGRFQLQLGARSAGSGLLAKARALYQRWGARAKVEGLDASFPGHDLRKHAPVSSTSTETSVDRLDLFAALKASQAISSELELPRLLETLMGVVIEQAGADLGYLVLAEEGALTVAAAASVRRGAGRRSLAGPTRLEAAASWLPESVVRYVFRTGERVVLGNAISQGPFSADGYLQKSRPRSMLCLPLRRKGAILGVLYLENEVLTEAFDPARLSVLELLCSQIASSIDNSRLYQASVAAVRMRDEFLTIASHELKTPLTGLKLQAQLRRRALDQGDARAFTPEKLRVMVAHDERQFTRLNRLVDDMLDGTRMASGALAIHPEKIDLGAVVAEVITRCNAQYPRAQPVSLSVESAVEGEWDPLRIEQVVTNLVVNAIKYGAQKPIVVRVWSQGERALIQVTDQGIGISSDDQARIFRQFERAVSANEVSGLGLGLYIARQIVEAHGGTLKLESQLGDGSTFLVELPRARR